MEESKPNTSRVPTSNSIIGSDVELDELEQSSAQDDAVKRVFDAIAQVTPALKAAGDLGSLDAKTAREIADALAKASKEAAHANPEPIQSMSDLVRTPMQLRADFFEKQPEPREPMLTLADWEGQPQLFLPQGVVGLLVAPGGTGKTAVLAQMAACVATGVPWLGCFEVHKTGPVLLVMGEEGPPEMDRRLSNIANSFGIAYGSSGCRALTQDSKRTTEGVPKPNDVRERFAKNIHALPLMGHRCPLIEPAPGGSYTTTGYLKAICEMVNRQAKEGEPYRAVIMDPAARFMGLEDENDNMGATHFIQALEDITKCTGNPTVLVAHHANKSAATGKANQAAARGASALVDNARWMAQMQAVDVPAGEDYRTAAELSLQKSNYGAKPPPMLVVRDGMGWFAPSPEDQTRISERARIEAWEREGVLSAQAAHYKAQGGDEWKVENGIPLTSSKGSKPKVDLTKEIKPKQHPMVNSEWVGKND